MTKKQIESVIANTKFEPQEIDKIVKDLRIIIWYKNDSYFFGKEDSCNYSIIINKLVINYSREVEPYATNLLTATFDGEEIEFSVEDCEKIIEIFENMFINADSSTFKEFVINGYCMDAQERVAEHLSVDREKLEILIKYGKSCIHMLLTGASNDPSIDSKKIEMLVKNADAEFKRSVAIMTNKPEILVLLAKDISEMVRRNVARNLYTPVETLIELKNDEWRLVRSAARDTLCEIA